MSSVQSFRQFISERLAAVAEEIFRMFEKALAEYEEQISCQRRQQAVVWEPEIKLHRTEHPQQHMCKEGVLCNQDWISSLDQVEPKSLRMKQKPEEFKEHLTLKQENDSFTPPFTNQKGNNTEDQRLCLNPVEAQGAADESIVRIFIKNPEESEPNIDHELPFGSSPLAESHDHEGGKHGDSISATNPETRQQMAHHKANYAHNPTLLTNYSEVHSGQKSLKCDTCGKVFQHESRLIRHLKIHTCEKPYSCSVCGKAFSEMSVLAVHKRIHTGEKPFPCNTCGIRFRNASALTRHMRAHTDERPYLCSTCGKRFRDVTVVKRHMRLHTGQSPYLCNTCGKRFCQLSSLKSHIRIHTGEKPFSCKICGKDFRYNGDLSVHMRSHTG